MNFDHYFCSKIKPKLAMRTILILLVLCFGSLDSQSQITNHHIHQGCSFDNLPVEDDVYLYEPSDEAERIVDEILDALGLSKNFVLKSANVPNALATSLNGQRYILYSTDFLEKFKSDANTQWAAYSVLAHEIGHHLNGHNFGETNSRTRKMMELEADQFSGSVLRMLGATIDEAQAGIKTFDLQGETLTHPSFPARKEAVSNGWKKRDEWLWERGMKMEKRDSKTTSLPSQIKDNNQALSQEWFDKATKVDAKDPNRKIDYYSKAIHFDPNNDYAYLKRGVAYDEIGKHREAIADYDKAIQLDPSYPQAYHNRGVAKSSLGQYNEAVIDFDNAIRVNPKYALSFAGRGSAKHNLGKYNEAIEDYNQAIKLDPKDNENYVNRGVVNKALNKHAEALSDFDKAIQIDPNYALAYANKGCTL
ncbi:MAG: tetratricopeptide repeat protein, partial [Saprospiraceae bacterium]|nr:tetratricopeptide repeat protein [Saprospiraceae bacterium]